MNTRPTAATLISDEQSQRAYAIYAGYRVVVAAILFSLYALGLTTQTLGRDLPIVYFLTTALYVGFAAAVLVSLRFDVLRRLPNMLLITLMVDVIALVLLNYASGGLATGLGFLLLVTVAAGAMLLSAQLAFLLAALATIGILVEAVAAAHFNALHESDIVLAGILGMLLFVTASGFYWISQRVRAAQLEAALHSRQTQELQHLNELIVERMHTGIIVIDQQHRVQLINGAAIALLGGAQSGLAPLQGQKLAPDSPLAWRLCAWQRQPRQRPAPFSPHPAANHQVQANFTLLRHNDGEQILIFIEDTRSLAESAQQLKLASLGHLTGSIAHEIRNPLGAISHAAQLLLESTDDYPDHQRLADIIKRQSDRMNTVIESILTLSRRKPPQLRRISLDSWLQQFCEDYRELASTAPTLELDYDSATPEITFDPAQLAQVVHNLVENALRHSHIKEGLYRARIATGIDDATRLPYLDVIDYGPGVRPSDQARVFEPFFTTSSSGTGLGLYIAKDLCETNYATLSCIPRNEGARFRIGFAHPDRLLPRTEPEPA